MGVVCVCVYGLHWNGEMQEGVSKRGSPCTCLSKEYFVVYFSPHLQFLCRRIYAAGGSSF